MKIPYGDLSPTALQAIVHEFVTRDGTDHSGIERRIASVLRQLADGRVELHFDERSETCNILPIGFEPPLAQDDAEDPRRP